MRGIWWCAPSFSEPCPTRTVVIPSFRAGMMLTGESSIKMHSSALCRSKLQHFEIGSWIRLVDEFEHVDIDNEFEMAEDAEPGKDPSCVLAHRH